MIDREQLRALHSEDLPLHVLEQDYIQALFLNELYKSSENLVFKGGTFLKHAHGLDRFSEDLDFTAKDSDNLRSELENTKNKLAEYGVKAELDRFEDKKVSFSCRLKYQGPLYQGSERSMGTIDIDISKRDDLILDPEWVRLFYDYPEIRVINALGLNKRELLAEKLRALSTRDKARDLYDCWFMVKQGTGPEKQLFLQKMKVVEAEPVIKISATEDLWERDLSMYLKNPPEFSKVKSELVGMLEGKDFEIDSSSLN